MSGMFGSSKTKQSSKQTGQQDPWDVASPYIEDFLKTLGPLTGGGGVTPGQQQAFDQIKTNVSDGNPWAGDIANLADDLFGSESQSGRVQQGYDDFSRRLSPTADGTNLDVLNNPQIQAMLQQVGDDAANRVNSSFAAAGRTGSMGNQTAVARGVTQAQLPLLINQYNLEQGRTDAAARDLYQGGNTASTTIAGLDAALADLRSKGIDVGNQALEAENFGPTAILNLEQQLKELPVDYAAKLAAILYPAGQLGQQTQGQSSGKSSTSGFSLGFKLA